VTMSLAIRNIAFLTVLSVLSSAQIVSAQVYEQRRRRASPWRIIVGAVVGGVALMLLCCLLLCLCCRRRRKNRLQPAHGTAVHGAGRTGGVFGPFGGRKTNQGYPGGPPMQQYPGGMEAGHGAGYSHGPAPPPVAYGQGRRGFFGRFR
ncbi:hypothetical protein BKA70DRAFT_1308520, partial [Coprinopsis sp. MPI-PUGE-AT-0042]